MQPDPAVNDDGDSSAQCGLPWLGSFSWRTVLQPEERINDLPQADVRSFCSPKSLYQVWRGPHRYHRHDPIRRACYNVVAYLSCSLALDKPNRQLIRFIIPKLVACGCRIFTPHGASHGFLFSFLGLLLEHTHAMPRHANGFMPAHHMVGSGCRISMEYYSTRNYILAAFWYITKRGLRQCVSHVYTPVYLYRRTFVVTRLRYLVTLSADSKRFEKLRG